mgnify:CR=1 FL=1
MRVSVVVCTLDRGESLADTLASLEQLQGVEVEVVVVAGPSEDATDDVLNNFQGRIKVVRNPEANLSVSRNLGIAAAAGELVAFIDDDAVADPWWLADLVDDFSDPELAMSGGPTRGPDGLGFQAVTSFADRFGSAIAETVPSVGAGPYLCRPFSPRLAYPIGTNLIARRSALVAVGGFDEALAFYLDEVDLAFRIADRGGLVTVGRRGEVTHRFLPSTSRNTAKVVTNRYHVLRSRRYFGQRTATALWSADELEADRQRFLADQRAELDQLLVEGLIDVGVRQRFEEDVVAATRDADEQLRAARLLREPSWFANHGNFLSFTGPNEWPLEVVVTDAPSEVSARPGVLTEVITVDGSGRRRTFERGCFVSYLEGERFLHEVATRLAELKEQRGATLSHAPEAVAAFLASAS